MNVNENELLKIVRSSEDPAEALEVAVKVISAFLLDMQKSA